MKLIYCIHSLYNPGGMERVLLNKVVWFGEHTDWEIVIVTTDQKNRPTFYPFPDGVRMVDLGVNYSDDNGKSFFAKFCGFIKRRQIHKRLFNKLLKEEKPEIVDCFYPGECSFVPTLKDGSKKVMELHQSKLFHHQYNRSGLMGLADKIRAKMDERLVRKFDSFVVLTEEDAAMWGDVPNIKVIPNAAKFISSGYSSCQNKRVIAVGRLDYQKSFDRLIEAWSLVQQTDKYSDWHLDIFGQGEWRDMLQQMIGERGLQDRVTLNKPTKDIAKEYAASSMLVMSSHYEGFPMVMIEAMACGLPVVTFDYKCGPRDIIDHEINGLLVKDGDIEGLAKAMISMMRDDAARKRMGENAKKVVETYSEEAVMKQWIELFNTLVERRA
ncbi:MAG: glycosyltransferase family 4 protein [Alistipes sp.]|nr:glycosyltransferase family 4 protein [Alistipes sp.]